MIHRVVSTLQPKIRRCPTQFAKLSERIALQIILSMLLLASPLFADNAPEHVWSQRFGSSALDYSKSVALDGSGNIIITGYFGFGGTINFGGGKLTNAGTDDIFLAKFDSNGKHLWSKIFGDSYMQEARTVAIDSSDNIIVTGEFGGTVDFGGGALHNAGKPGFFKSLLSGDHFADIFLAKFDANGNHLWSKIFGDSDAQGAHGVAIDSSDNIIVTGRFGGTVDFGGGALSVTGYFSDIFLAKFDSNGKHLWSKRFGDSDHQMGQSVAIDSSDNIIVTGLFGGTVGFGTGKLSSSGDKDIFLAKFDSNGNHLWSKRFGDSDHQNGESVAIDSSGNIIVTGYFEGTMDFGAGKLSSAGKSDIFLAKFDSNGNHLWSRGFGDSEWDWGKSVTFDHLGNVILAGDFRGTVDFGGGALSTSGYNPDIFLAIYDTNGNHLWSKRFGDSHIQTGDSVGIDSSDNIIVTGAAAGTVDFGGGALSDKTLDVFLAKFGPSGAQP